MASREDAVACAAKIIAAVERLATHTGPPTVMTGRVVVEPNLSAAVVGEVALSVDIRHPDARALAAIAGQQEAAVREIALRRGIDAQMRAVIDHAPCACSTELVELLTRTAERLDIASQVMHSGAAHDSQKIATQANVAMIFVRSRGGRSHTPEEFTSVEDAVHGIRLLTGALYELGYA